MKSFLYKFNKKIVGMARCLQKLVCLCKKGLITEREKVV